MEQWTFNIDERDVYHKVCKNCRTFFDSKYRVAKYCCSKCRNQYYAKKKRRKARRQKAAQFFTTLMLIRKRSFNYTKLTFILSFIGFLGSIGFYIGVLRQVYGVDNDKHQIELLKSEKEQLRQEILDLTKK